MGKVVKVKKRRRGGASVPCPTCRCPTEVLVTRRTDDVVKRRRRCQQCAAKFWTTEQVGHG